jgi:lactate dehydrogenase-like 2-hydroxyacid dehydrogenase
MQGKGLVFVTGDRLGDQLTVLLEEAGCQVVRGPQPHPPALTVFPKDEWPRWFGETDVLVVSPRDVCSREVMLAAPRLRAVVSTVIGVETIDLDAANDLRLIVGHGAMPENTWVCQKPRSCSSQLCSSICLVNQPSCAPMLHVRRR